MKTYTAEATVTATGVTMWQDGLTSAQIEHLRVAESQGRISGLTVSDDVDLVAAFGGR